MTTTSILVSLHNDGGLQMGLPAIDGGVRWVPLRDTEASPAVDILSRVLHALERDEAGIGTEGAPTQAQVRHWQAHAVFPSPKCAFCQAEARLRLKDLAQFLADDGATPVTRVAKGKSASHKTLASNQTAEDLGL